MKMILKNRWLMVKHQLWRTVAWLFLPLILTMSIMTVYNETEDDFRAPVGIVVMGEEGEVTEDVLDALNDSGFVRVSIFHPGEKGSVLRLLEQNNYDSVFLLAEDFEKKVTAGNRRGVIDAYYTDVSLFYEPVKELIASVVQQSLGEEVAKERIFSLNETFDPDAQVTEEGIEEEMVRVENEADLVNQVFYFEGRAADDSNASLNPWAIWAYLTIILSIFIYDFVTWESKSSFASRFHFMTISLKSYLLSNLILMTLVMSAVDLIAWLMIVSLYGTEMNILSLLIFRLIINMGAFLMAAVCGSPMKLYQWGLFITIIMVALHMAMPAIISLTNIADIASLHPAVMLLDGNISFVWLIMLSLLIIIWKRGDGYAGG